MRILRMGAVAGLAVALAACPDTTDRTADTAAVTDTPVTTTPTTTTTPATQQPAGAAGMAERVDLQAVANSGITGEAMVQPVGNETQVMLTVRGAPANSTLQAHIHRGSCDAQGPVVAPLDPVTTDGTGTGTSTTTVSEAPMTIMDGQHYVQAHTPGGDPGPPATCGEIPQHTM